MSFWSIFRRTCGFKESSRYRILGVAAKQSTGIRMVGQVVRGQMAGLAWWEFAISRLAKGFVATAAEKFGSTAIMNAPALMSQASAQPFTQCLVFGDRSVDSGFYKVMGNPDGSD